MLRLVAAIERSLVPLRNADSTTDTSQTTHVGLRARSIRASVAIEGNPLRLHRITELVAGKSARPGLARELEVRNTAEAYERLSHLRAWRERDLLKAHGILMRGLIRYTGCYRPHNVRILQGPKVAHLAPPHGQVPRLVLALLHFVKASRANSVHELHPAILGAIVHYELAFIHPFSDGNGRMARLWHHLILRDLAPCFAWVPLEEEFHQNQRAYYRALGVSDKAGNSPAFVEFALKATLKALQDTQRHLRPQAPSPQDRLRAAGKAFAKRDFVRADYCKVHPSVRPLTASRDLALGVELKWLKRSGDRRTARYRFTAKATASKGT